MATKVFTGALLDFFLASGAGASDWSAVVQPAWITSDNINGNSGTVTYATPAPESQLFLVLASPVDDATVPPVITMTAVRIEYNYGVACAAATRLTNVVDKSIILPAGGASGNFDETSDPTVYFGGTSRADLFANLCGWAFASIGVSPTQSVSISAYTLTVTYTGGPEVTRVTPSAGTVDGGQAVTITGTGFTSATGVEFDGVAATAVVIVSDTSITAVTPAHASGTVDVEVLSVATGAALYTYVIPPSFTLPPLPGRTPIMQGGGKRGR